MNSLTPDSKPINKQAAQALSSGKQTGVQTIEEALEQSACILVSRKWVAAIRKEVEAGKSVRFQVVIKKQREAPGFIVVSDIVACLPKTNIQNVGGLM